MQTSLVRQAVDRPDDRSRATRGATVHDGMPRRLGAWAAERFPASHGVLFLVLYAASLRYGRAIAGASPAAAAVTAAGFVALYGFFLVLRVLDEHKDYALDCRTFPDRVLQRGVVTLGDLRGVGIVAALAGFAVSLWRDGGLGRVTGWWMAAALWSALMAREFWVREWLRSHLVCYALTHMLVVPLLVLWVAQMGAGERALPNEATALLAGLAFSSGLAFEIARKLRAPADERDGVDSYTRVLGVPGAALAVAACLASSGAFLLAMAAYLMRRMPAPIMTAAVIVALLPGVAALLVFARAPSSRRARIVERLTSAAMLAGYLALLATLARLGTR